MSFLTPTKKNGVGYGALLIIMIAGIIVTLSAERLLDGRVAEAAESGRPARIAVIVLTAPDCEDCASVDGVLQSLASAPAEITDVIRVPYTSERGREIVAQYDIAMVPALIFTGELEKENIVSYLRVNARRVDDAAVSTALRPVLLTVDTGAAIGRVTMTTVTDARCATCYDPAMNTQILTSGYGVVIAEQRTVDVSSAEGKALRARYGITAVPTFLMSDDALAYPELMTIWPEVGSIEDDRTLVFRDPSKLGDVIYKNLITGELLGSPQ